MRPPHTVTTEAGFVLVDPEQGRIPLAGSLLYTTEDPYAVQLTLQVGTAGPVEWIFSRDLLACGLKAREGLGDVRVWPEHDGRVTCIRLASPFGEALLETPAVSVVGFLALTYQAVPAGTEHDLVDLDAELANLRAGGTPW